MGTITHEGKLYRKVARMAKPGDKFIQLTDSRLDLTKGKVYMITEIGPNDGDVGLRDDVGDERWVCDAEYVVLEPVISLAPITLISTTPAVEKTYTVQLTEHTMGKLIHALRYYASDVSSGEELRDQFEAISQS